MVKIKKAAEINSAKVIDKLTRKNDNISSLAVAHADEIIEVSLYEESTTENTHQWLDKFGWVHKTAYLMDIKGNIYVATLNIAKAKDGRNILYDINKKETPQLINAHSPDATSKNDSVEVSNTNISQDNADVNNNSMQKSQKNAKFSMDDTELPTEISKLFSDSDFYSEYENEDKTVISESLSELQGNLDNMTEDNSTWEEQYEIRQKIRAKKEGYDSIYDYYVGHKKKNAIKEYRYDPEKYNRIIKKKTDEEDKTKKLESDINNSTPHKRAQYFIIQENNPMWDDFHVGIRSPKDIKTFE